MGLLGLLAVFSLFVSGVPGRWAWPLAAWAVARGAWLARREWSRPACELVFPGAGGVPRIDGVPMQGLVVAWRGPLAFLRWRDPRGRVRRLMFWPDVLPAAARRELRLATPVAEATPGRPAMAP